MKIHTVKAGDTIFKIARQHATSPMKIIENNELENPDRLVVGEKLLVLNPTRTYSVRGADTLDKIADRFDVTYENLLANNPYLSGTDKIYPGQLIAIKYDTAPYGSAYANGYYYKSTTPDRLALALPYLTYITVSAAKREGDKIKMLFSDDGVLKAAKENKKIPLIRVYDEGEDFSEGYLNTLIDVAKSRGYRGITLAAYRAAKESPEALSEFIKNLKARLSENGLLLFYELDGNSDTEIPESCDGYVIMYEKAHLPIIPSFEDGERRVMTSFAERGEARRAYIDIPSFAYMDDEELSQKDAKRLAYSSGQEILYDTGSMINHFNFNRYEGGEKKSVRVAYESPENIKAKLELLSELGFMGISFDIMQIPIEYLMMFHTMFCHPRQYIN